MIKTSGFLVGCLTLAGLACGEDDLAGPAVPDRGQLQVIVESPFADDGALILSVGGGPIDSIAAPGLIVAVTGPVGGARRVLVRGAIRPGPVLTIFVPDRRQAHTYTAKLEAAASRTTYAQRSTSAYRVGVSGQGSSR